MYIFRLVYDDDSDGCPIHAYFVVWFGHTKVSGVDVGANEAPDSVDLVLLSHQPFSFSDFIYGATTTLGRTGLRVTRLGYGSGEVREEDEAARILNEVLDVGINYLDTSIDYGCSDELIGKHLAHRRSEFYLARRAAVPWAILHRGATSTPVRTS